MTGVTHAAPSPALRALLDEFDGDPIRRRNARIAELEAEVLALQDHNDELEAATSTHYYICHVCGKPA